ncbi:cupin domain-containing protein [Saccharolobus islandicus]|uniref:cupin domain-containing protein n=1 Tax=Saccharolobus islandicus TaxID=43080 RepID=UPI000ACCE775|nr:cupin domain-containing protein [Sulfolobus islandicus]
MKNIKIISKDKRIEVSVSMDLIIVKNGIVPFTKGDPKYFTGNVIVKQVHDSEEPSRVTASVVTFEPSGRTNWHYYPLGQLLIGIYGTGLIQTWRSPPRKIKAGDVIRRCNMDSARCVALAWCYGNNYNDPYNYSRIAIQEKINGKAVEWLEKVSDKECEEVQSASD